MTGLIVLVKAILEAIFHLFLLSVFHEKGQMNKEERPVFFFIYFILLKFFKNKKKGNIDWLANFNICVYFL